MLFISSYRHHRVFTPPVSTRPVAAYSHSDPLKKGTYIMSNTNHYAEAKKMLAYAAEWAEEAGVLDPRASELTCLAYAAVHALLAIRDALIGLKPPVSVRTHPWSQSPLPGMDAS